MRARPESYTTTRIETSAGATPLGSGSGFVYQIASAYFLVTNWHVVTGRNPITLEPISKNGLCPDRLSFHVTVRYLQSTAESGSTVHKIHFRPIEIDLAQHTESDAIWWEGVGEGYIDDIAVVPLERFIPELADEATDLWALSGGQVALVNADSDQAYAVNMLPEVSETVFVLGYPQGQSFQGVFPVWKRGSIASEPLFGTTVDGVTHASVVYVDASTNPGMSGAPVLYFGDRLWTIEGMAMEAEPQKKPILVGVYAGRDGVTSLENSMGLGRVWKASVLEGLLFQSKRRHGGSYLRRG